MQPRGAAPIFAERVRRDQLIAAGGKPLLLEAHEIVREEPDAGIVFIADCDFDVPAGRLKGSQNLIITECPAVETDSRSG